MEKDHLNQSSDVNVVVLLEEFGLFLGQLDDGLSSDSLDSMGDLLLSEDVLHSSEECVKVLSQELVLGLHQLSKHFEALLSVVLVHQEDIIGALNHGGHEILELLIVLVLGVHNILSDCLDG